MTRFASVLLVILCNLLAASIAVAQSDPNTDLGIIPFGGVSGGSFDSVGVGNGSLFVKIPIISYKQRGTLTLSFSLLYNSKTWVVAGSGSSTGSCSSSSPCNW